MAPPNAARTASSASVAAAPSAPRAPARAREHEHRRPGTGDDRGDARARAATSTSASEPGMTARRYSWCSRSCGRGEQQVGASAERLDQQRRPAGLERGVAVRHGRGQDAAGGLGRQVVRRHDRDQRDVVVHRQVGAPGHRSSRQASVAPPSTAGAALSGWPSICVARSSTTSSDSASGSAISPRAATMPATTAAADEPSPRPCGIRLWHTRCRPGLRRADEVERGPQRADHQVPLVVGHLAGTLARDLDARRPASRAARTSSSSCSPRARPSASNPGPRLALVAGTRTRTWSAPRRIAGLSPGRARSAMDTTSDEIAHGPHVAAVGRAQRPLRVLEPVARSP